MTLTKMLLIMKCTAILLLSACLTASASGHSQTVSFSGKNVPVKTVFASIEKQTDYVFFYDAQLLKELKPVTIDMKNVSVEMILKATLQYQPLDYVIRQQTIFITRKENSPPLSETSVNAEPLPVTIKGRITNEKDEPVAASIIVKGTKNGTTSNADGYFELTNVDEKAILLVTGVNLENYEVRVNGRTAIDITVKTKVTELDAPVMVAYNTTTKRNNVGAVTVVKGEQLKNLPVRSVDRALQGFVPGLQITSGSGLPGGNVSTIILRGIATGGDGISRNPLFVIDGLPVSQENFNNVRVVRNTVEPTNPLAQINANDIESISVLKDAAAIALYGSRASNGVILITTKQGKSGKLKISFDHQTDISGRVKANRDVLNQEQYLELLYESYKNSNATTWTDQAIFNDLKTKFPYQVINGDTSFYPAPDWFAELYSDNAVSVSNDLSVSGGSDKSNFYLGMGYLSQSGVLKGTGFRRGSLRYNVDMRPFRWLRLGVNSSFAYTHQDYGTFGEGITEANGFPYYVSPLLPVRQNNGSPIIYYPFGAGGGTVPNPVASMAYNQYKADGYRGFGNVFAEVSFLKHFSFRTTLGGDLLFAKNKTKTDKRVDGTTPGAGSLREIDELRSTLMLTNLFRYQQVFRNTHYIDALLSQEAQVIKSNTVQADASGFNSGFTDDEITSGTTRSSLGGRNKNTFLSYFGQVNYSFKQKYFASAGVRLDGSSRFGANVNLNKFWSFGAGWIMSQEKFLAGTKNWLDFLKLRGSVGVAGNTISIPPNTRYNVVSPVIYTTTPNMGTTVALTIGNPDIKSESTLNTDLGIEARLWKERISLTADVYMRKTYDMVTRVPTPLTTGRADVYQNLGDIENKGVELSLSVDVIRNKNITLNIYGNWSRNSNKLVKASDPESFVSKFLYKEGENYESWYMVRWAGVDPADGSAQWLNAQGNITKTYNSNDRVLVGKPQPDGYGGFGINLRYRDLELSNAFYYSYGAKVYNSFLGNGMLNDGRTQPYANQSTLALDRWQKPGDIAMNPKRVLNNPVSTISTSTRYLVDGDYIRLKNVMLSYRLKTGWIEKLKMTNARVFIQASNIALWTKEKALDPDNVGTFGESLAAYPQQKSFSLGLNVNF